MTIIDRLRRLGRSAPTVVPFPADFEQEKTPVIQKVRPFTMTGVERIYHLIGAVEYVVANNLPGALVECGVWKGGSMMTVALTLMQLRDTSRELFLYDTYEGNPTPGAVDVQYDDRPASEFLAGRQKTTEDPYWAYSPLDAVKKNMLSTGYPESKIHFVKGKVEETIPNQAPERIALLRLDTDWYESTRHEMTHLYPRLVPGGAFIIDDYGWWKGARKAVDEYLATLHPKPLLHRIDDTCRAGIKI
jgi:O-methyltransferase